jgi:hypothetical protein
MCYIDCALWCVLAEDTDMKQGKVIADVCKAEGVKFVVWSSLHDADSISKGTIHVPHYSEKNKVEQYIKSIGLPAAFVYAGWYSNNLIKFPAFAPYRDSTGSVILKQSFRPDVAVPIIHIELDFGQFVVPLFKDPKRYLNAKVLAASEYITFGQIAQEYEAVTGEHMTVIEEATENVEIAELRHTYEFFNTYGYYNGESITKSHQIYDKQDLKLHSFKQWMQFMKFKVAPFKA